MNDDHLAERAAQLAQDGRNKIQGLVGPPTEAAQTLRRTYLSWCDEVERFLEPTAVGLGSDLQSPRHRDIVNGVIPSDQLWREIGRERDLRLSLLDSFSAPATPPETDDAVTFVGQSGKSYRWFPGRILGRGASIVYEGEASDGQLLAIKRVQLRSDGTTRWYADARLAEREIQVFRGMPAGYADHLMPVLDHALGTDELILVMPRAKESLADRISAGDLLDEHQARALLLRLADALQLLVDHGVIHRDIKPQNLFWWQDRWVLGDLGIAHLDGRTGTYTWTGTGTHEYWAPELFTFAQATVQSDFYAVGCTIVEALTGRRLFGGDDLARRHREDLPELPPLNDPVLERVLLLLLKKDPHARPTDARHLKELLTPSPQLTEDQMLLQQLAARAEERTAAAELRVAEDAGVDRDRAASLVTFQRIWDDLVAHAVASVADPVQEVHGQRWFLLAADGRLTVTLAEPADRRCSALMLGSIQVAYLDGPKSDVANLICRLENRVPTWQIISFAHNFISPYKPVIGRSRADDHGAMGLSDLEGFVDMPHEPGPPRIISRVRSLTHLELFRVFARELAALTNDLL